MAGSSLQLPDQMFDSIQEHLFGRGEDREQGGFLICDVQCDAPLSLAALSWLPMADSDYVAHEIDYLELTDAARGRVIKAAHDAAGCLVELHSHPGSWPACFSTADLLGLVEFVPHVRWRLRRRPFAALVFGRSTFDGLAWQGESKVAVQVTHIRTSTRELQATGLTMKHFGAIEHA